MLKSAIEILQSLSNWWHSQIRAVGAIILPKFFNSKNGSKMFVIENDGYLIVKKNNVRKDTKVTLNSLEEAISYITSNERERWSIEISSGCSLHRKISYQLLPDYRIRELAQFDIANSTPFDLRNSFICLVGDTGSADGYFIVKDNILSPVISLLEKENASVNSINLRHGEQTHKLSQRDFNLFWKTKSSLFRLPLVCFIAIIITGVFTYAHFKYRNHKSLTLVEEQIDRVQKDVTVVRKTLEKRQILKARLHAVLDLKKTRISTIEIWEEFSKLLPDTTWLATMKIEGDEIIISGYSKEAAALIPVIDASKIFMEPNFDGPVVSLEAKNIQRFAIKANLER